MSKVINKFRDKFTKKVYEKGDTYTHNDEGRIAFLVKKGFLEKPKAEKSKEEKPKKPAKKKGD